MHDIDRTQVGFRDEYESAAYPARESEYSVNEEMQLTADLLEVESEEEFENYLEELISSTAKSIGGYVGSETGQSLGGVLKGAARQILQNAGQPASEFEYESGGYNPFRSELREWEAANKFVKLAQEASLKVAQTAPGPNLSAVAYEAVASAAKSYAPDLLAGRARESRYWHGENGKADEKALDTAMSKGERDENKLTNAVFYARHPEWKAKPLKNASAALRREWIQIRDKVVRPAIKSRPAPVASPPPPPPPAEKKCNTLIEQHFKRCIDAETRWYLYLVNSKGQDDNFWKAFLTAAEFNDKDMRSRAEQRLKARRAALQPTFGNYTFENIRRYRPLEHRVALEAQDRYAKVADFLPMYKKIMNAIPNVSIGLARHGVGHLVFSIDNRALQGLVEDPGLKVKIAEMAAGEFTQMVFGKDLIARLGLGLVMLELAEGLHNEKMVGASGPDAEEWRRQKKFQFVLTIMAEDIRKRQGGDARAIVNHLANRFRKFQPLFHAYSTYVQLEDNLGRYEGKLPDRIPPSIRQR